MLTPPARHPTVSRRRASLSSASPRFAITHSSDRWSCSDRRMRLSPERHRCTSGIGGQRSCSWIGRCGAGSSIRSTTNARAARGGEQSTNAVEPYAGGPPRVLGHPGPVSSASAEPSIRFAFQPSSQSWYLAHNVSIVTAYLDHRDLAERENRVERFFINLVLIRLLFAHALVAEPRLALAWLAPTARWLGDPRRAMTGLFLSVLRVLPDVYPLDGELEGYIADEHTIGRLLDLGVIATRIPALYDWAAGELEFGALADLVRDGTPTYAWDPHDPDPWMPPPTRLVRAVRRMLPPSPISPAPPPPRRSSGRRAPGIASRCCTTGMAATSTTAAATRPRFTEWKTRALNHTWPTRCSARPPSNMTDSEEAECIPVDLHARGPAPHPPRRPGCRPPVGSWPYV